MNAEEMWPEIIKLLDKASIEEVPVQMAVNILGAYLEMKESQGMSVDFKDNTQMTINIIEKLVTH